MSNIKRYLSIVLSIIILFSCMTTSTVASANVKEFRYDCTSSMDAISLKWKAQKGVSYYNIYRAIYNEKKGFPAKKEYTKIAKVKGTKYKDKNCKSFKVYAYIIRGYNAKKKLVCSTYSKDSLIYQVKGLGTPELYNGGEGEIYDNSSKCLVLYSQCELGVSPDGYVVYRKASNEKKYKKIGTKKGKNAYTLWYFDKTVKSGETYKYKVKTYKIGKNKKKIYSQYSNVYKQRACNVTAKYKLEQVEISNSEASFKLCGAKGNGKLRIKSGKREFYCEDESNCMFSIDKYSLDGVKWKELPEDGYFIDGNESVYLKCSYSGNNDFNLKDKEFLFEDVKLFKYYGSGLGSTIFIFDFENNTARSYMDWD